MQEKTAKWATVLATVSGFSRLSSLVSSNGGPERKEFELKPTFLLRPF
jgi:hypothetical protein